MRDSDTARLPDHAFHTRLLDSVQQAVVVTDLDGMISYWNRYAETLYGWTSDEVIGRNIIDITPSEITLEQAAAILAQLATGTTWTGEFLVRRRDGTSFWAEVSDTPVLEDGILVGIIGTSTDVTERKQAGERERLLASISNSLQESLDPETTLRNLVTVLLPSVADWCSVVLVEDDGSLCRVAVVHTDPAKASLATELMHLPVDCDSAFGLAAAIRSGHVMIDPDVRIETWHATVPLDYIRVHEALGISAMMHVPLVVRGRVIGGIAFFVGDSGRHYTETDLPFVEEIARRAALAIDNARLHDDLRESEAKHRHLIERLPAATYIEPLNVASGTAPTPYISPQIEQITGYSVEHWQTFPNFSDQIIHPNDRDRRRDALIRTDQTGEPYHLEYRINHRDGHIVWISNEAVLVHDDDGRPLHWHGILTDVTQRKRDTEKIAELAAVVTSATDAILTVTVDGFISNVNNSAERLFGYNQDEMLGQPISVLIPEDRRQEFHESRTRVLAGEPIVHFETVRRRKDGSFVDVAVTNSGITNAAGEIIGSSAIFRDITERKQTEIALRESENRFRGLIQHAADMIGILDTSGFILYESPAIERGLGYHPDELVGRHCADVLHPDEFDQIARLLNEVMAQPGVHLPLTYRCLHKNGSWRWLEATVTNLLDVAGINGIVVNARDISEEKNSRQALEEAETRYRLLVEQMPAMTDISCLDEACARIYVSPQVEKIFGYTVEEWLADPGLWLASIHPDDRESVAAEHYRTNESGEPFVMEYRIVTRLGETRWIEDNAVPIRDRSGQLLHWQGLKSDITVRKHAVDALRDSEAKFRTLVNHIPAVTYTEMLDGTGIVFVSPQVSDMLGYAPEAWTDDPTLTTVITHPDDVERVRAEILRTDATGEPFDIEKRCVKPNGEIVWVRNSAVLHRGHDGTPLFWQGFLVDITRQKRLQERLTHLAFHDALTGLPNRGLLTDRMELALASARRTGQQVAILFLDLDNFKVINDSLGHAKGDDLLIVIANRLRQCVREVDTVTRLGGDEFVVLLPDVAGVEAATDVARRIANALGQPIEVGGRFVRMHTSIGIVVSDGRDAVEDLLRHADISMYRAKRDGKNRIMLFSEALNTHAIQRLELEEALRRAIDEEQFVVHYQPMVLLCDGQTVGMEALVRWQHPERGLLAPAEFIPLAEETGLIVPLGFCVLREAVRQAAMWNQSPFSRCRRTISVNLSAMQFRQPDLVVQIASILRDAGLDPQDLVLEITESVVMDDAELTIEQLHALKAIGVAISIDDFGTGYSSLAYLQRFPVDVLKIDRSFVAGLGHSAGDTAIITAIISMAHSLGITVVAEGVETQQQMEHLLQLGCDRGQGYYFAKPLPAAVAYAQLRLHENIRVESRAQRD